MSKTSWQVSIFQALGVYLLVSGVFFLILLRFETFSYRHAQKDFFCKIFKFFLENPIKNFWIKRKDAQSIFRKQLSLPIGCP